MTMKTPHPGTQPAPLSHRFCWLLLRGITRLNYRQQKGLSRILTGLAPTIARRRIQIVRTNLKLCFPDLSDEALA
ncbi:MAG: lipid A biosynthesis lauroyl acyltransferase, partial [Pseudomonadales bacterium]